MSILTRQCFMTLAQLANAVLTQVTLNNADYTTLYNAINAAAVAVKAAYPSATLKFETHSYQLASGRWVRQFEIYRGVSSVVKHWDQAVQINMYGTSGGYFADLSTPPLTTVYSNTSALGNTIS